MLGGGQDGDDLLGLQGAGSLAGDVQLHRSHRYGLALGRMVQERLVGAPGDPTPGHQLSSHAEARSGVVVVETEHPSQVTVHRGWSACARPLGQHDHIGRRCPQPGHETGHVLDAHLLPAQPGGGQELEPQLQADSVSPHGVGRTLDGGQVGQVALGWLDHLAVVAEQRPGLGPAPRHEHPLDEHGP